MEYNKEVTQYIANSSPDHIMILENLRQLIHSSVKGVVEEYKWNMPVFSKKGIFTYLKSNKNHVTLGFYKGVFLDDPNKLLEGTGKELRHVKIQNVDQINESQFTTWLQQIAT